MSLDQILDYWKSEKSIIENIVTWRTIPERSPTFDPIPGKLHPSLLTSLHERGIYQLFSHQSASWECVQNSKNIVVVSGTASGKTLCYNLPILDYLLRNSNARALYLFPTKALAQDQLQSLKSLIFADKLDPRTLLNQNGISAAIYDGDTPSSNRSLIRTQARIIFSNPDMLHTGVLPHHTSWSDFFRSLKFVVIDEIHTYRGVFGSHVANVIRRLRRILNFYSADPVFILTSATIANPISLAEKLVGVKFHLIDQDGSSRGKRDFLIYNPPIIDQEIGLRKSPIQESIRLAEDLFQHDVQTIIFGRTRPTVEIILTYLKQKVGLQTPGIEQIRGYRGGYLPTQRREIEAGLRSGQIRTVVATNALELGIDIGGLGAALLVGFPGTIAATHQQSGRAGRGLDPALSILVATADPIDQFLAHHPDYFFTRTPESALINPDNLLILINHLKCSTFELPFRKTDIYSNLNNEQTGELLDALVNLGDLHQSGSRYFWMSERYPAQEISLRTSSAENVVLQEISLDDGNEPVRTIGTVDLTSSYWMVHPHAIYLHEAQTFFVKDLDLEKKIANLIRLDTDYYTEPRRETEIDIIERTQNTEDSLIFRGYGEISVKSQVIGFKKIRWFPRESLGFEDLNMPLTNLLTMGYWIVLRNPLVESLRESGLWKNDSNQYGPNWRYQADLARERDEHKCQICGIRETDRAHDVHHKTPFRMFTSVEQANQLSNLITLCPGCHKMVEVNVRVRSGLAGLAYVIGHISPLFLMCDQRDIGVHFDPLSNLFEGLPILVIYESFPAGLGFSKHLFEIHNQIIHEALELVTSCSCSDGCPSCVGPGGENGEGGKEATKALLEKLRL